MGTNGEKEYSRAFEKLVESPQDIEGAIAYAIYKWDKRTYIQKEGLELGDPKIRDYHKTTLGDGHVTSLKNRARNILAEYAATATAKAEQQAKQAVLAAIAGVDGKLAALEATVNGKTATIETTVRRRTRFWPAFFSSVAAGVVATFVFAFVLTVAVWLSQNKQNPLGALYKLLHEQAGEEETKDKTGK